MDYLDQPGIRKIRVNLPEETIEADILGGRLTVNGKAHEYPGERDESYRNMHRAAIEGREPVCTFAEGLAVMDLIDASERALQSRMWVTA
jgi:predicted dehydrogenase